MFRKFAPSFKGTRAAQYLSSIICSLGVTITSMHLAWPSPTLPILTSDDSPLGRPLSSEETSWIVAASLLSGAPAAISYHLIVSHFGRRMTMQICSLFLFVPWFFIIFANDVIYIYVARVIAGLLLGVTVITTTMYNSEIADPDIRGRLGTTYGIMKLSGTVMVLAIGPFVPYEALAIFCAVFPFLYFFLLFLIPESPYYLVRQDRCEEARDAVIYLSGKEDPKLADDKIDAIRAFVTQEAKPLTVRQVIGNRTYLKVIAIVLSVTNLVYLSGSNAITPYQQTIIAKSDSSISPEISSIIFGLIQIPAAIISAFLVDKLGRKVILYIGGLGCFIPLTAEGVFFFLEDYLEADVSSISWIPTTGIVIYQIMNAVYYSIPYILLGECFIDQIKNIAITCFLTTGVVAVFLVSKTFEPIVEAWGLYTAFWIYAFFTLATVTFAFFGLPETKGKTFEEIELKMYK